LKQHLVKKLLNRGDYNVRFHRYSRFKNQSFTKVNSWFSKLRMPRTRTL